MENRNFEQARELHQSGQLQEAFNEYQQILTLNPDHEGATFGQGLIFLQSNTADNPHRFLICNTHQRLIDFYS